VRADCKPRLDTKLPLKIGDKLPRALPPRRVIVRSDDNVIKVRRVLANEIDVAGASGSTYGL
jgi:hypothetical protein